MKQKQGEQEAMEILKAKGYIFDELHVDDGRKKSLPDLRFADGRYLEVTHTYHNNGIVKNPQHIKFNLKSIAERRDISQEAWKAWERIHEGKYGGSADYLSDIKAVQRHFGAIDPLTGYSSEFHCDLPVIVASSDNVLREIEEKAKRHSSGDVDLFIFVLEEELNCVLHLIETRAYNGAADRFMRIVCDSPFHVIYLCQWDFDRQHYEINNPHMVVFSKANDKIMIHRQ